MHLSFKSAALVLFGALLFQVSAQAANPPGSPLALLSVGRADLSLLSGMERAPFERDCVELHNRLYRASLITGEEPLATECMARMGGALYETARVQAARSSKRYNLYIQSTKLLGKRTRLRIENWNRFGETDFDFAEWTVEGPNAEQELQRHLKNFLIFYPRRLAVDTAVADAFAIHDRPVAESRHWRRALAEVGTVLGLTGLSYYLSPSAQDVFEPSFRKAVRCKLTSFKCDRFDDNRLVTNGILHGLYLGPLSYLAARDNGFSAVQAIIFNGVASTLWETGAETREIRAGNDQGITIAGGSIVGETVYQLERFFGRGSRTIPHKILKNVYGYGTAYHHLFGRDEIPQASELDRNGLPADAWHAFELLVGSERAPDGSFLASAALNAELIKIAEYGKTGESSGWRGDTPYTRLDLGAMYGKEGMAEVSLYAKMALGAYYKQSIEKEENGNLKGYSFMLAPSSAYELRFDTEPGASDDEYGIVNVLGQTLDLTIYRAGFKIRATIDVFGDFAQMRSMAWAAFKPTMAPGTVTKAILEKRDDYFGYGFTTNGRATVSRGPIELGGDLRVHHLSSIEGFDTNQENVTDDFHLKDRRETRDVWLSYTLPGDRFKLTGGYQQRLREGSIRETQTHERFSRIYGRLSLLF